MESFYSLGTQGIGESPNYNEDSRISSQGGLKTPRQESRGQGPRERDRTDRGGHGLARPRGS